jgi:hypothetical protein
LRQTSEARAWKTDSSAQAFLERALTPAGARCTNNDDIDTEVDMTILSDNAKAYTERFDNAVARALDDARLAEYGLEVGALGIEWYFDQSVYAKWYKERKGW